MKLCNCKTAGYYLGRKKHIRYQVYRSPKPPLPAYPYYFRVVDCGKELFNSEAAGIYCKSINAAARYIEAFSNSLNITCRDYTLPPIGSFSGVVQHSQGSPAEKECTV